MAFEILAPHIDIVEAGLASKKSPRAIARELGQPGLYETIRRYKIAVFDLNKGADEAWRQERAKSHEERLEQGKARIIDSLELLNKAKLRADQLLSLEIGQPYETAEGQKRALSYGAASVYWVAGQKMAVDAIRQEQEIAGDDPESRKADALSQVPESDLIDRIAEIETLLARGESGTS